MNTPKHHVGQIVYFVASAVRRGAPGSAHRVERLMPAEDGRRDIDRQYRLKAVDTGRERIAREDELSGRAVIEALAQSLYEADNPTKISWARRDRTIRDSWFKEAVANLAKDIDRV